MIPAISHNALLSAALGAVVPPRTQSINPRAARHSNAARGEASGSESGVSTDTVEISALGRRLSEAGQSLTPEQQQQVRKLKDRDQEVRRHEQAHKSAAGSLASGSASFEFETGPDGKRYAVGGEVSIDTSEVSGDPQATITKMQQVRRAALAPGHPSGQDQTIAAKAASIEQSARAELAAQRRDGQGEQTAGRSGSDLPAASAGIARTNPGPMGSGRQVTASDNTEPTRNVNPALDLFV